MLDEKHEGFIYIDNVGFVSGYREVLATTSGHPSHGAAAQRAQGSPSWLFGEEEEGEV